MTFLDDFFEIVGVLDIASRTFVCPVTAVIDPQMHILRHLVRGVVIDTAALILKVDNECIDVCLFRQLEILFEMHAGSDVDAVDLIVLNRFYLGYFRKRSPVCLGKIVLGQILFYFHAAWNSGRFG